MVAKTNKGNLYQWGMLNSNNHKEITMKPQLVPMPSPNLKIGKISCGWAHTIFTLHNAEGLYGWGDNKYGQLDPAKKANKGNIQ